MGVLSCPSAAQQASQAILNFPTSLRSGGLEHLYRQKTQTDNDHKRERGRLGCG